MSRTAINTFLTKKLECGSCGKQFKFVWAAVTTTPIMQSGLVVEGVIEILQKCGFNHTSDWAHSFPGIHLPKIKTFHIWKARYSGRIDWEKERTSEMAAENN